MEHRHHMPRYNQPVHVKAAWVWKKPPSLAAGIHDFDNWACCQTINQRLPQLNTCCTLRMQKSKNVFPFTLNCISLLSHPDFSGVKKRWSGGVAGCAGARIKRKPAWDAHSAPAHLLGTIIMKFLVRFHYFRFRKLEKWFYLRIVKLGCICRVCQNQAFPSLLPLESLQLTLEDKMNCLDLKSSLEKD